MLINNNLKINHNFVETKMSPRWIKKYGLIKKSTGLHFQKIIFYITILKKATEIYT